MALNVTLHFEPWELDQQLLELGLMGQDPAEHYEHLETKAEEIWNTHPEITLPKETFVRNYIERDYAHHTIRRNNHV